MKTSTIFYFALIFLFLTSCHPTREEINTLLLNETKIPVEPTLIDPVSTSIEKRGQGSKTEILTTENHKLTQKFDHIVAFDPNANGLFPGSLVQGKGLQDGLLFPVTTIRSPLRITMTGFHSNSSLSFSRVIKDPNPGNINDSIESMIKQGFNSPQSANITFAEKRIFSLEQAFFQLGASYSWASGNINGSLSISKNESYSKFLVRIVEQFFTVSSEAPKNPIDYISKKASRSDLRNLLPYIQNDGNLPNPLCYVSSVSYGRELWLLIESSKSSDDLEAALNASFGGLNVGGKINTDVKTSQILEESSIQAFVLGGSEKASVDYVTGDKINGIKNLLSRGETFTAKDIPRPISYVVSYLKDNSVASVKSVTDYKINTTKPNPEPSPLEFISMHFDNLDDGKNRDSGMRLYVYDSRGINKDAEIAYGDLFDNNSQGIEYRDNSSSTLDLSIRNAATDLTLAHGVVVINMFIHGHDTWKFNSELRMRFKDGSSKSVPISNCVITQNNPAQSFPF